ncbi:cation:proton antiporter [Anaerorudis cellulosivorans]|uniref:cation:proton antiporter n=1 Tax=Anaerorudis cellulosivorans TaxID=3397862 RepID=UPI00221FC3EC|nr:cation:proton antiporter [Seramator thermalis]MCW1735958.1 cation:proton antiporter [Seramator thermalis]
MQTQQTTSIATGDFALPLHDPILVFLVLLAIVLIIPSLFKRINLPSIIGLIIAGILVGPYGFDILSNDSGMEMFSTIGLMYIMFTAGLELDFNEFVANRNKSLIFGFFTFMFPLLIGYPICRYVLGYDQMPAFLTASMFSTHTLVSYPIVSRMGVSKNQAIAITVGGTIFTDAAVLIILAIITSANDGALNGGFWVKLIVSLILFSIIVFLLIPKLAKWFFQKVEDDKYSHYIFVLFILFVCGFLAELGGLEPIIGAFAAGLALNRLIPHTSALMNRIDFFGNALFIPIFLISVGMIVDVKVVLTGWETLIVALVLTCVAIMGKWLAAFFTQKAFNYSASQRGLIFGLSSSHAAATLAIIIVGYQAGILDEYILNGTIILILITCIISSLATQRAAKQLVMEEEESSFTPAALGNYAQEKILVAIANPANIGYLVDLALLIKDPKSPNPVSLLGVVPNNVEAEKNIIKFRQKLQESVMDASAAEMNVDIITTIDYNIPNGIVRTARETMADIVIMGWPGGKIGLLDKLLGDKVDATIRSLDKNLFICHLEKPLISNSRIVVISPPLAEKEYGFSVWLRKVVKLAQELSLPVVHLGHPDTQKTIADQKNIKNLFVFIPFTDWNNPMSCAEYIKEGDLIMLVSAHRGYISYIIGLDHFPTRLETLFPHHNRIIIYPQQHTPNVLLEADHPIFTPFKIYKQQPS